MNLQQRKDLKQYMHRIACAANTIKRAAHVFQIGEDNFLQMQELVILVEKARVLMDALKTQPIEQEDSTESLPVLNVEPLLDPETVAAWGRESDNGTTSAGSALDSPNA